MRFPGLRFLGFAMNREANVSLEDLDGRWCRRRDIPSSLRRFHDHEDDSEVGFLKRVLAKWRGLRGLLLFEVGDLLEEIKLSESVVHGAVFLGGGHFVFPLNTQYVRFTTD
jgi:hypothetical protein